MKSRIKNWILPAAPEPDKENLASLVDVWDKALVPVDIMAYYAENSLSKKVPRQAQHFSAG